jgi:hypothetical protein
LHPLPAQLRQATFLEIEQAIRKGDVGELQALLEAAGSDGEIAAARNGIERLLSTAEDIMAKECRGSVRREFPGQFINKTLQEIMKDSKNGVPGADKALKLLNDLRFKK